MRKLIFGILLLSLAACKKETVVPPTDATSCASYVNGTYYQSQSVQLNSCATNVVSYSWDFGDSTASSTEANPHHSWTNPGTYTVTLTVTGASGNTSSSTTTIVIKDSAHTDHNPGAYTTVAITKIELLNFPAKDDVGND